MYDLSLDLREWHALITTENVFMLTLLFALSARPLHSHQTLSCMPYVCQGLESLTNFVTFILSSSGKSVLGKLPKAYLCAQKRAMLNNGLSYNISLHLLPDTVVC